MEIAQGCSLTPPQDAGEKWLAFTGQIGTAIITESMQTWRSNQASKYNYKTMREAFTAAGDRKSIGGDGFIEGSEGFQDSTSEPFVSEPTIVNQPAPVIVPPAP